MSKHNINLNSRNNINLNSGNNINLTRSKWILAITGCSMGMLSLIIVNYLVTPDQIWFIYPFFIILLSMTSILLLHKKRYKLHAVLGSLLIICCLILINYNNFPFTTSFLLYSIYPLIWWPITIFMGERAKSVSFAVVGSTITIVYYVALNIFISPQYLWAIFPTYVVSLWPVTLYFVRRKQYFLMSVVIFALSSIFFITVNTAFSPHVIWAIYPIFIMLWWPLSTYYFQHKRQNTQHI